MEQNANIKVSTYSEVDYQKDYSKWKENKRFCKSAYLLLLEIKSFVISNAGKNISLN